MRIADALPADRRAAVEELLRSTDLTLVEIGARTGVNPHTVSTWNRRSGIPRPPRMREGGGPSRWPPERRGAIGRLCGEPRNDPGDIAEAVGLDRADARWLLAAFGGPSDPRSEARAAAAADLAPLDAATAADAPTLRAHLRHHIARQIAAFDAALKGEGAAVLDSARVLRDLGGLKRLFDEVAPDPDRTNAVAGVSGDGGTGSEPDLPKLRAEIARRYARFVGERETA